jgi:glutamate-1-semialdehyde 2,1-aminomutase
MVEKMVERYKHRIAAIITEPVATAAGCILPEEGWLQFLRSISEANDILLVFDEIMTGLRYKGCAQGYFGVLPDVTVLGKALGAGFPIAAFGGRKDLMSIVGSGVVTHSGTYNGNAVGLAAADAFLDIFIHEQDRFSELFELGNELAEGLVRIINGAGHGCVRGGLGPRFTLLFTDGRTPRNVREAQQYVNADAYSVFWELMRSNGVLLSPRPDGVSFLSTAHTRDDIKATMEAAKSSIEQMAKA